MTNCEKTEKMSLKNGSTKGGQCKWKNEMTQAVLFGLNRFE